MTSPIFAVDLNGGAVVHEHARRLGAEEDTLCRHGESRENCWVCHMEKR